MLLAWLPAGLPLRVTRTYERARAGTRKARSLKCVLQRRRNFRTRGKTRVTRMGIRRGRREEIKRGDLALANSVSLERERGIMRRTVRLHVATAGNLPLNPLNRRRERYLTTLCLFHSKLGLAIMWTVAKWPPSVFHRGG